MKQLSYWLSDHITYRIGLRRCHICGKWQFGCYWTFFPEWDRWVAECVDCVCK